MNELAETPNTIPPPELITCNGNERHRKEGKDKKVATEA